MIGSCSRVKSFCREDISLIENYDKAIKDKKNKWVCHHRLETHTKQGKLRKVSIKPQELIDKGLYYNRPAKELIFLTRSEHIALHNTNREITDSLRKNMSDAINRYYEENGVRTGIKFTKDHCKHISEAKKGTPSPFKGKHHTEEAKRKLSEAHKGKPSGRKGIPFTDEHRKHISENHWDSSGKNNPAHIINVLYKWYIKKYGNISIEDFRVYYHENKEKLLKIYWNMKENKS